MKIQQLQVYLNSATKGMDVQEFPERYISIEIYYVQARFLAIWYRKIIACVAAQSKRLIYRCNIKQTCTSAVCTGEKNPATAILTWKGLIHELDRNLFILFSKHSDQVVCVHTVAILSSQFCLIPHSILIVYFFLLAHNLPVETRNEAG